MRLHGRLAELARLGATGEGIDRGLFTPAERAARERLASWCRAAGLRLEQDRVGNLFARLDAPGAAGGAPIQCGSHLDTVRNGGAYDGAYGVVGGLEALQRIAASGRPLQRSLEVVAWAGEEGSRFPLGCLGSSVYAGQTAYDAAAALVADDGESFGAAVRGPNGLLDGVPVRDGFPPPAAYVELHVEQGPVMENCGARLGIVSAIAGQRRFQVAIEGVAGHSGTVPMTHRADALCAASELVLAVERAALAASDTVATVGQLVVDPNQTNIIPGHVLLRIDLRSIDDGRITAVDARIRDEAAQVAQTRGLRIGVTLLESRPAVTMAPPMRSLVRAACLERDPQAVDIVSGAGHDAMCVAAVAPVGMIFVPSIGGRSHVGDERTEPADLELGVDALVAVLLAAASAAVGGSGAVGASDA